MVTEGPAEVLHGRRAEREQLDGLLEGVRGGQSRVLVITGEPGVGKTALLESGIRTASGFRVLRVAGIAPAPDRRTRRTNCSKVLTCFKQVKPR